MSADRILVKAYLRHFEDDFPIEMISLKYSNGVNVRCDDAQCQLFISQVTVYDQSGSNLKWRSVINQPALQSVFDSIELGNPLLGAVIVIGILGIVICLGFIAIFYHKSKEQALAYHDWCFTCIFLVECALFNSSIFTLIGCFIYIIGQDFIGHSCYPCIQPRILSTYIFLDCNLLSLLQKVFWC